MSATVQTLSDAQYLAARPLPNAPDGRYDAEVVPVTAATTNKDPHSNLYRVTQNISDSLKNVAPLMKEALDPTVLFIVVAERCRSLILLPFPQTFQALVDSIQNKDALDDRKKLVCSQDASGLE